MEIADAMVTSGMKDAGYLYVNIDDCWHGERDADGYIQADPVRFPSGIAFLADYIHFRGLKLGIYSDAGTLTCQSRPGSRGYEQKDADQYAAWEVDYLKYDWCYTSGLNMQQSYTLMRDCLLNTYRPIVYSICSWQFPGPWVVDVGNLWRTTGDIQDNWGSIVSIIDTNANLYTYAGPGHWNDPDMLEVGNGGMTDTEYRAHFSMWCIMAAPLIAGNDLRNMSQSTIEILTAPEVIAVDQDPLGKQGRRVRDYGASEVWVKELVNGNRAVALFNRSLQPANITVLFSDLGPEFSDKAGIRDLWSRQDLGVFTGSFTAEVPRHGVVLIKVEPNIIRFVDFNEDGKVDSMDLAFFAALWSQTNCDGCSGADLTANGKVDFEDLAIFVENWLMAWTIPPLPAPASDPHPRDRQRNVDLNYDLGWTAGADAISHDVYFGTTNPPPFIRNQTATTFDPNKMDENTGHFWRIDEVNMWGTTTGTLWRFTTGWDWPPT
jgi:alpha-galactosidase